MVNLRRSKLKFKRAGYDSEAVDKCTSHAELSKLNAPVESTDGSE